MNRNMAPWWLMTVLVALAAADLDTDDGPAEKSNGTIIGIDLGTTYSWYVELEFLGLSSTFNHYYSRRVLYFVEGKLIHCTCRICVVYF